jgi:general secretion pathway protein K
MSLLVAGIVAEARVDTRMAQLHYFKAQAMAAGDGAIQLALAEQFGRRAAGQAGNNRRGEYKVGDLAVEVRMLPADVLVNIETVNASILMGLFQMTVDNPPMAPAGLAAAVIRYRDGVGRRNGHKFHSLEDLLAVPEIDRGVFDAVQDYIVVTDLGGGNRPGGAIAAQAGGNFGKIAAAMRGEGELLQGVLQHQAEALRVDALVTIGDQQWLRRRWVKLGSAEYSSLPWRVTRSESARPLPKAER